MRTQIVEQSSKVFNEIELPGQSGWSSSTCIYTGHSCVVFQEAQMKTELAKLLNMSQSAFCVHMNGK